MQSVHHTASGEEGNINLRHRTRVTDLGVGANGRLAFLALVGECVLVALDAVGMFVTQHVAVSCQREVT